MTSRQRVTEAIHHRTPDRMPIDMGMYTASGISAFAYRDLRRYLGLPERPAEIIDGVQMLARVEEDVRARFHCDCVFLKPRAARTNIWQPRGGYSFLLPDFFAPEKNERGEWVVQKGEGRMRMPPNGYFFDGDWLPLEDAWEESFFRRTAREAERIFKETDGFTIFRGFYPFFDQNLDYFCDMLTDPDTLIGRNERRLRTELDHAAMVIETIGGYVGGVSMSGDLGTQRAPFIRPETFERVSAPFLRKICSFFHENSDLKVFLHSCGAIEPLIPLLIDCGVDILNPVQISAEGMRPEALKRAYGDRIVFWGGGADTQNVLGTASPQAVAGNVRQLTSAWKPGGGYVFCPVHNIMGNVPPENIVAAYDAAYENSFY